MQEIRDIKAAAETYHGGSCAAAVGMMLYAGIRPHEVARLTWAEVDLQAEAIYIAPRHSKTSGARRVTIHKPLHTLLRRHRPAPQTDINNTICPPNWQQHWRRQAAKPVGTPLPTPSRRMPCATPSPATTSATSAATPNCNSKSATATPTCCAHAT